jgi:hypothetical protein
MTAGIIDKLMDVVQVALQEGVTPNNTTPYKPFKNVPTNLNASVLVGVLRSLNLQVPTSLTAAAAKGESFRASGHRYTIKELDAALTAANVPISDRFRLKQALTHNGILGK